MKLLIRNLARSTKGDSLKALFEAYGKVQYCTIIEDSTTGESKGFAFVEMPKAGDAKAAVKNLNNKELDGNKLRVKKADTKPNPKTKES
jgi:RNA recognition motif-containing protein